MNKPTHEVVLKVDKISRSFYGKDKPALDNISFSVCRGDFLVISGANGSGKSVLMHLIANLDSPSSGTIELYKHRVGLVFQNAEAQILGDTVIEDVCFGPRNLGQDKQTAYSTAQNALEKTGLTGKEDFPARSLSGGEKRRLAVAGILAMDADIFIFDEPFANLDWPGILDVTTILQDLHNQGKTILVLTHELEKVLALASHLLILYEGSLVWQGKPSQALERLTSEIPQPAQAQQNSPVNLEEWGIRNPLRSYTSIADLIWKKEEELP